MTENILTATVVVILAYVVVRTMAQMVIGIYFAKKREFQRSLVRDLNRGEE